MATCYSTTKDSRPVAQSIQKLCGCKAWIRTDGRHTAPPTSCLSNLGHHKKVKLRSSKRPKGIYWHSYPRTDRQQQMTLAISNYSLPQNCLVRRGHDIEIRSRRITSVQVVFISHSWLETSWIARFSFPPHFRRCCAALFWAVIKVLPALRTSLISEISMFKSEWLPPVNPDMILTPPRRTPRLTLSILSYYGEMLYLLAQRSRLVNRLRTGERSMFSRDKGLERGSTSELPFPALETCSLHKS